ncbi:efflux RND transporter periplasmic adaptor subunit [uncultured Hoeflea sp.]|uniref:efflux RND transporter periplasmic adaptor subunit n=1 Tax=uncultured Hoeflea sp. TaxID=538666 RepID=UPI00261BFC67|nr:efflux RND transporter periplasmic adaptor subunit [uncultured Hoeflea sp.]
MAAQTGGRIVELHPAIDQRANFSRGDVLFRLDDRQAQASLAQLTANRESAVAQRGLVATQLERTRALRERGIVAQDQLDQLQTQMQEVEASVRSIAASVRAAEESLVDTVVTAPFDGRVQEKLAELGSVIGQGAPVARIYSSGEIEVEVSLREDEASLIPGLFTDPQASGVVEASFSDRRYRWEADIARVERQINDQTRTIDVTLALRNPDNGQPVGHVGEPIPALINTYATVELAAPQRQTTFVVPASSVRGGNRVWLVRDGALQIVDVDVVHREGPETYVIADGVVQGMMLITSQLASAIDGMPVDVTAGAPDTAQQAGL